MTTDFPERLAAFRKARGQTQQGLADAVGVHVTQLRRYEARHLTAHARCLAEARGGPTGERRCAALRGGCAGTRRGSSGFSSRPSLSSTPRRRPSSRASSKDSSSNTTPDAGSRPPHRSELGRGSSRGRYREPDSSSRLKSAWHLSASPALPAVLRRRPTGQDRRGEVRLPEGPPLGPYPWVQQDEAQNQDRDARGHGDCVNVEYP